MDILIAVLLFLILAGVIIVGWRVWSRNVEGKSAEADALRQDPNQETVAFLKSELVGREQRIKELGEELVALKTDRAARQEREKSDAERIKALENMQEKMQQTFKNLAQDALEGNRDKFMTDANEKFLQHMAPVKEVLEKYQKSLAEMEKARKSSEGALRNEMENVAKAGKNVGDQAASLAHALRGAPTTRGRWGERTLRNVMELAGMSEHCDFDTQKTVRRDDATLRPDAIIYMPGGHCMVVDAKTSLNAYLDSVEEADEAARDRHLKTHARAVRDHMTKLASKAYWENLTRTPDFVVMFMPGENFYAAAVRHDPALFEDAIKHRVLITSPTTFIALVKAVAYGWRQDAAARDAEEIVTLGRELYKRLQDMGTHVLKLGKSLGGAVDHYNKFIGSLENRVLSQARRFDSASLTARDKNLAALEPVETAAREPVSGRDLHLPAPANSDVKESETADETS